jgi:hypothetical protein
LSSAPRSSQDLTRVQYSTKASRPSSAVGRKSRRSAQGGSAEGRSETMLPSMTASGPASRATAGCKDTRRGPCSVGTSIVQLPPSRRTAEVSAKRASRTMSPSTTISPVESGTIAGGGPAVASTIAIPPSVVGRGATAVSKAPRSSAVNIAGSPAAPVQARPLSREHRHRSSSLQELRKQLHLSHRYSVSVVQ